ncbi:MAG: acetyl-CoA carboxylase subunit beta [Nitrospirae bacterium GWF2_44_13]|nr:MAG: acetyl-CoA carboxylase subunit beta [Nitrospirae bacterium GWF2_44_13]OGW63852.1 MAG: acetyl-CoA carboxylase subunit beta [Nitrospirae bacterium RIFOXYA2_FULL_44_9]HBG92057.1 acetyl-CoA carboxylase carboxyl transferase subunit beta [Nitrospiraceae bacterium]
MWFKKLKEPKLQKKVKIPEGLWVKCDNCKEIVYKKEIDKNLKVCPKCDYHFRISAKERIGLLADTGSFAEFDADMCSGDPLNFKDSLTYPERLQANRNKSSLSEAVVSGEAAVNGFPVILTVMDFSFMGGSMGSVVGEKITRAAETALEKRIPLISIASSGGARMQEGIFSLMQMAKVSAAIGRLKDNGIPYISVLADPTFGGVAASFATIGDVIIAEPRSLIGFAGPRVIEQTMKQQLPDNFQRAEFLFEHGLIDMVVSREDMKKTLAKLIEFLS